MPTKPPVYRFAPSPNGELHLGHAFSAMLNYELAKRSGGRFLLRIEDIDQTRARPEHVKAIYRDLKWLGLEWEIPVRVQSDHFGTYRAALSKLEQLDLLYPSFATRKEIATAISQSAAPDLARDLDPDGAPIYPGQGKALTKEEIDEKCARGETYALRLDMEKAIAHLKSHSNWPITYDDISPAGARRKIEINPARWGDVIIARKDTPASYHLSVVVDDAIQGVSHIVRGRDLEAATDIHRLLQIFLELPEPAYHHHKLIIDQGGKKLSKSASSKSLHALKDEGATADMIWQKLGLKRS